MVEWEMQLLKLLDKGPARKEALSDVKAIVSRQPCAGHR